LIGGAGADSYHLSKGRDKIKGFSISEGDRIVVNNTIDLTFKQIGKDLLLKDNTGGLRTTLELITREQLFEHQPELFT
jgi:hypothetical protein